MNIAIIPARGGSKRIPRKNIKPFCGKPIIAYSIQAALASGVINKVVVSTDDPEIADVALHYGAEVPFLREKGLADDMTGTTPVVRDAIAKLQAMGWELDNVACIYATAPLLEAVDIRRAFEMLTTSDIDYVFTAARFSFPIQRALLKDADGGVVAFDHTSMGKRSQDLPETYHDAGQLYMASASTWLDANASTFSHRSRMLVLPLHRVQDIDTNEDWVRAEMLYRLLQQESLC